MISTLPLSQTISNNEVPRISGTEEQQVAIQQLYQQFNVTVESVRAIVNSFMEEMQKGLNHKGASVPMIPSFVTGRPTGNETGKYLALDLGGTNLRVCEFELKGDGNYSVRQQKYIISEELKTGDVRHLFDFIADCVDNFIFEFGSSEETLELGFTFSFPVNQTAINRGTLMQWTKGFSCRNAIDKDVVVMLQDAFLRKNVQVHVAALVNDTVGTLMAHSYRHPESFMGVILGTGTNAAYYEKLQNITKWEGGEQAFDDMVINMEWGAFDLERRVLPYTAFDNKLDRESINPRKQPFEKMVSGMYLGEIARNVILHLVDRRLLFSGNSSSELNEQWSFETSYMSAIVADSLENLDETRHILEDDLQITSTSLADRQMVQLICSFVGRRAARLSASGIAAVLSFTGHIGKNTTIAVDGSVYEFFPHVEEQMKETLSELLGQDMAQHIKFSLSRDGSGFGAAIIAMMAYKASSLNKPLR
ncbi:putative glucokinase [Rhizopus microsporus ATCC 52813]|uniref:Phosphotransferase n=1 Tax=Rhizopus microsporus ATCC 52813 TaxID=1340429 RepID=A0A2G4SW35_RHIZD|nr:putative glucokinase [Rhizopus microsporus ATCC 52813]PHZ12954.1 putative glucokinase [Rhizopus microsporus ATCC 52813]